METTAPPSSATAPENPPVSLLSPGHPVLFTRHEHGNHPIWVTDDDSPIYRVGFDDGPKEYTSARQMLIDLHGGKDKHLTFDRYFRLGKWAPPERTSRTAALTVFDLLDPIVPKVTPAITVATRDVPVWPEEWRGLVVDGGSRIALGVDLEKRGHEVAKLFHKGFGARVLRQGLDPQDVLQEVYKGIITRNNGKCPFDPRKSSFGHYVHMVTGCVLSNYQRRERERKRREKIGIGMYDRNDGWTTVDVAASNLTRKIPGHDKCFEEFELDMAQRDLLTHIGNYGVGSKIPMANVEKVLPLLPGGFTRQEMADRTGLSKSAVTKTVHHIRDIAREWRD